MAAFRERWKQVWGDEILRIPFTLAASVVAVWIALYYARPEPLRVQQANYSSNGIDVAIVNPVQQHRTVYAIEFKLVPLSSQQASIREAPPPTAGFGVKENEPDSQIDADFNYEHWVPQTHSFYKRIVDTGFAPLEKITVRLSIADEREIGRQLIGQLVVWYDKEGQTDFLISPPMQAYVSRPASSP